MRVRTSLALVVAAVLVAIGVTIAERDQAPERTPAAPSTSSAPRAGVTRYVDVERIVDGDTIVLGDSGGTYVRVLGIDTPEEGDCGYKSATTALSKILLADGVKVRLVRVNGTTTDRYQRLLRFIEVTQPDGTKVDAGLRQIERGYAIARYDSRDGYKRHPREDRYHQVSEQTRTRCGAFDVDGPE